jgi:hypothetical protein
MFYTYPLRVSLAGRGFRMGDGGKRSYFLVRIRHRWLCPIVDRVSGFPDSLSLNYNVI